MEILPLANLGFRLNRIDWQSIFFYEERFLNMNHFRSIQLAAAVLERLNSPFK